MNRSCHCADDCIIDGFSIEHAYNVEEQQRGLPATGGSHWGAARCRVLESMPAT
jgi:hypothetical protein